MPAQPCRTAEASLSPGKSGKVSSGGFEGKLKVKGAWQLLVLHLEKSSALGPADAKIVIKSSSIPEVRLHPWGIGQQGLPAPRSSAVLLPKPPSVPLGHSRELPRTWDSAGCGAAGMLSLGTATGPEGTARSRVRAGWGVRGRSCPTGRRARPGAGTERWDIALSHRSCTR